MKEILIYFDKEIEQTKLEYVLTNINIHPFCKGTIQFSSANQIEIADLLYSKDAINQAHQCKMFPLKKLLLKEIDASLILDLNQVLDGGKILNFVCINEHKKDLLLLDRIIYEDIFETLFFHWSRYEEVVFPKQLRNEWDLMPEEDLFSVKNHIYHEPFIDHLILWLIQLFLPTYLPTPSYQLINTFDIDYQHFDELSFIQNIKILLSIFVRSKHPINGSLQFFQSRINKNINLSFIKNEENKGVIYILCGGQHKFDFYKSNKAIERIKYLINACQQHGFEVGVHPSFDTCYSSEMMSKEIELLSSLHNEKIVKSRQHFLHIDYQSTIPILEKLGIEEDSSTGFNLHTGFKVGTGYNFYYWNWEANRKSTVLSKPIIWMDSAQWYQSKKQILIYKMDKTKFFKNNQDGTLCINQHPIFQSKLSCFE